MMSAVALGSCQPPAPSVFAVNERGGIVFHVRERGLFVDKIFGYDDARFWIGQLTISRASDNQILWAVGNRQRIEGCKTGRTFPIRYGETRCSLPTGTSAKSLLPDQIYNVRLARAERPDDCEIGTEYSEICPPYSVFWDGEVVSRFLIRRDGSIHNIRVQ